MAARERPLNGALVDTRSLVPLASHELVSGVLQCSESLLNNLSSGAQNE
jgi:hypothetical protein